ncbi:glutamyl-tRNA(Gln) and/or aspartyl-tRNA(Asn) amidotransferase, C subunit [Thermoplasmatales archaeon BRNA1]|nr:glutamyl-tRNA(Gln) and/or aspartyl-tRNA(Asn) amidotransferase, C subunit [Thermoplasmatales archaeon BRNA1]
MDKKVVARVAKTAHLELSDEELEKYSSDLQDILDYFKVLDEAPGHDGVGVNPVDISDVLRDDVPDQEIDSAELLKDMKTYENYIRGPKLV